MRTLCFALLLLIPAVVLQSGVGSNRSFGQSEWTVTGGGWVPFLPEYKAGSIVGPGGVPVIADEIFHEDMVDLGGQLKFRVTHHFSPTRTFLEAHASIAGLETESGAKTVADAGPGSSIWMASLDGTAALATPDTTTATFGLDSDVLFNDQYIGLRDRFDLTDWGIGELIIGCGFHHMRFDQDFQFNAAISNGFGAVYQEELDSTFLGGQIVSTIKRKIFGRTFMLDTNLGFYDLTYNYDGASRFFDNAGNQYHNDQIALRGTEGVTAFDIALRTDMVMAGVLVRPTIGMKYISDMPTIIHPNTNVLAPPVRLSTESSYFLNFGLEILL